jgi:hypothetical protein
MLEGPTSTDPTLYRVVFENDRVRGLEYRDRPATWLEPPVDRGGAEVCEVVPGPQAAVPASRSRWSVQVVACGALHAFHSIAWRCC